jgi:hypothetical protein
MPTKQLENDWDKEAIQSMHDDYMRGTTLRDLGRAHGVSHERVRQLFVDAGLSTERPKGQTTRRYANEISAWHRKEEIWDLYRKHGNVERVAVETELPHNVVAKVIRGMPARQAYRRKGETQSYDREKILSALREAAKICGEPLTIPAYRKEAPTRKWPADLTVIRAFGTWEKACKEAGVKANPSEGPRRGSYTAEDCIKAVRLCAADIEEIPSYDKYVKWARANRRPSGGTVRVKVGSWREVLKQAFED